MTYLTRSFSIALVVLVSLFFFLVLHKNSSEAVHTEQVQALCELTQLPGIALSTSYLEHRIFYYGDYSNYIYLGMTPYRYMDFVYAK